jgi:hypothetical protein
LVRIYFGSSLAARFVRKESTVGVTSRCRRRYPIASKARRWAFRTRQSTTHQVNLSAQEVLRLHVGRDRAQNRAVLDHLPFHGRYVLGAAQIGLDVGYQLPGLAVSGGAAVDALQRQQAAFLVSPILGIHSEIAVIVNAGDRAAVCRYSRSTPRAILVIHFDLQICHAVARMLPGWAMR